MSGIQSDQKVRFPQIYVEIKMSLLYMLLQLWSAILHLDLHDHKPEKHQVSILNIYLTKLMSRCESRR